MNNLEDIVKSCKSFREVLTTLNRSITGRSVFYLRKKLLELDIDTSHFVSTVDKPINNKKLSHVELLVKNRQNYRESGKRLRRALIESGIEYKCNKCGLNTWQNTAITLEVNHIDGNFLNNEKENLEFLCPNCHSLTSNFYRKAAKKQLKLCKCGGIIKGKGGNCFSCAVKLKGLKTRKVERPSKELLQKLVWKMPTTKIAKSYDVSDVAVGKWCKQYKIDKPTRGFWVNKKY